MAERIGEEKRGCWLDAPNKGIHKMVFVLTLAITAVAALLQSHAHSAFAYSPFEWKYEGLQGVWLSSGTVPEYGKANGSYLKIPFGGNWAVFAVYQPRRLFLQTTIF